MKLSLTLAIIVLASATGCKTTSGRNDHESNRALALEEFEMRRTADLRHFFRTEAQIQELEYRRVCLVRVGMAHLPPQEIFVGDGQNLAAVLVKFTGTEYDGQAKVVSRDSIIQTPRATYEPERAKSIQVHPGDLVFVQARD